MKDTITLRPYRPEDLEAIFRMDQTCFEEPFRFDRRSMRRFAEAHNALALIAETNTEDIAGFVIIHLERDAETTTGYVVTLDVSPQQRRSGIATMLMTQAEHRARHAGAAAMTLHVYTGNEAALSFYEERGYKKLGAQRRFYGSKDGVDLDAFTYSKRFETP